MKIKIEFYSLFYSESEATDRNSEGTPWKKTRPMCNEMEEIKCQHASMNKINDIFVRASISGGRSFAVFITRTALSIPHFWKIRENNGVKW